MPSFPIFSSIASVGCLYLGYHFQDMAKEDVEKVIFFEKLPKYTVQELGAEFDSHPEYFTKTPAPPIQCMVHGYTVQKSEQLVCANRDQSIDKFVSFIRDKNPDKVLPTGTRPYDSTGKIQTPIFVPKKEKPLNKPSNEQVYQDFLDNNVKNTPSVNEFLLSGYNKRLETSPYVNSPVITTAAVKLTELEVFNTIIKNSPLHKDKSLAPGTLLYKIQTDHLEIGSLWVGSDVKIVDKYEANRFDQQTNLYIPRWSSEIHKEPEMFPKYYITLPVQHIPLTLCDLQNTINDVDPLDINLIFHSDHSLVQVNQPVSVGVQYQEHTVAMREPVTIAGEFYRDVEDHSLIKLRPMSHESSAAGTTVIYNPVIAPNHLTKNELLTDFRSESDQFTKMSKISYVSGGLFGLYALGNLTYIAASGIWSSLTR